MTVATRTELNWIKVHTIAALTELADRIFERPPYSSYTHKKRDKNNKPICFLGHRDANNYLIGHTAIWFADDALHDEGMKIVESSKSAPGAA